MNILTANQIREADAYTIAHEPISSINLMERAAGTCSAWINEHLPKTNLLIIICGTGNNGGDGLAIARQLFSTGYTVEVLIVPFFSKASEDFLINKEKLKSCAGLKVTEIMDVNELFLKKSNEIIIIDALIGSGLSKPVEGKLGEVIRKINSIHAPVISIDIPSGLSMDNNEGFDKRNIIHATHTLTFSTPKLPFMFADHSENVGEFHILDIGLDKHFIASQKTKDYWLTPELIASGLKTREKFSHKGNYGHALLIAGSYGKIGAAVLSAKGCLRAGTGLLTTHLPRCGNEIMQTAVPEAMVETDEEEKEFSQSKDVSKFNAIGVGPGIGTSDITAKGLKMLIQNTSVNMVLDADALNILSENKTWLSFLKPGTIITPHPGEFARLAGKSTTTFEAYTKQKEFAMKYKLYVVLKGAHTSIATPDGNVYFNSTGNPGMAAGGSGDTLTGIILGLLAQGYSPFNASLTGIYLHGLAGDIAADEWGMNSLIAEDISNNLGKAYQSVMSYK